MKPDYEVYRRRAKEDYDDLYKGKCPYCLRYLPVGLLFPNMRTACCNKPAKVLSHWVFYNYIKVLRWHMHHYREALQEEERKAAERERLKARYRRPPSTKTIKKHTPRQPQPPRHQANYYYDPSSLSQKEKHEFPAELIEILQRVAKDGVAFPWHADFDDISDNYHLTDEGQHLLAGLYEPDEPMYDDPHVGSYYRAINEGALSRPIKRAYRSERNYRWINRHRSGRYPCKRRVGNFGD